MKTIRQIADEIGVSKQAIQKRIAREPLYTKIQKYISTNAGVKYIDVYGENAIKEAFSKKQSISTSIDVDIDKPTTRIHQMDTLISMLQDELKAKDHQIENKDEQISQLTKQLDDTHRLLDQQQQLQMKLQIQLEEKTENKRWRLRLPWIKKKA